MTNASSRDPVLLTLHDEVATLTINRPQANNALTSRTIDTLLLMLEALENDSGVKALIIEGMGDHFCAGEEPADPESQHGATARSEIARGVARLTHALRCFPKLVITKVRGSAHGLGLELVAASDVAIATPDTTLAAASPRDGAGRMAMETLSRCVGAKKAASLLFTGEILDARQAERVGLISRVVAAGEIDACVLTAARNAVVQYTSDFGAIKQAYQQQTALLAAAQPIPQTAPRMSSFPVG